MFLVSVKLSRRRILLGACALVAAVGLGVAGIRILTGDDAVASAAPVSETGEKIKTKKVAVKTNEDRIAFAHTFGWELAEEPAEVLEVIIPEEFDEVYLQYNSIQKEQGFNLEKYAGKRVKRFSYTVTNYPGVESEVRFNLLVQGDKVIGGDVSSLNPGGFMHGFEMK